jgi:Uncharacterized protein conserved in bacteria (DUF2188)
MKRIDIVKKDNQWVARSGDRIVARATLKAEAIRRTAQVARGDRQAVSVKIHKQNGRIQEERTYPRSADPRRTEG